MMPGDAAGRLQVRDALADDLPRLHAINEASTPGVNSLAEDALSELIGQAAATLVVCRHKVPQGFVLAMSEGLDYDSVNYRWLSDQYERFAYVDRVAIAPEARGQKLGARLYEAIIARFAGQRPVLLAEVNLAPPNPGSLRFHERHEFRRVGERWSDDGAKGVVYLARGLSTP
jgi:uncharacterized protein